MRRSITVFYLILFFISLTIFQMPAAAEDRNLTPLRAILPKPLTPRLSADGKTLSHGLPLRAVVFDPRPSRMRRIPAPEKMKSSAEAATAGFSITYIPEGGKDAWHEPCYTFPEEAKECFEAAADIWAHTIQSDVPITIEACWADLGSVSTLGYSGGGPLHANFSGATQSNTWYVGSLANALHGSDLDPSSFDMHITYNRYYSWYYGTDGNTPYNQMDLMSVVLHEIGHGLNFSGSMKINVGIGSWGYGTGYPNIYDVFVRDGSGTQLIDTSAYSNSSVALASELKSNDIWFHGSQAMEANGNQPVKIYAPATWSSGSSYSHLDYATFNDTASELMVYAMSPGESIHDPGAVTRGLLEDLGWRSSSVSVSASFPTVTTAAASAITSNSASSGGDVTSDGEDPVTARGVCWTTSANPTISNNITTDGTGTGSFTSSITGLSPLTTYHVRAYATNTAGTGYGADETFTTSCVLDPQVSEDGTCGGETPCYGTIQGAVDAACTGSVIKISQGTYPGSISLNADKSLTLQGGWDSSYTTQTSNTTFIKIPTAPQGSLRLQMVTIKP